MEGWLLVVVPLLTTFLGGGAVALFTRRSAKESNATTAFDVAAKSLLATNEALRGDMALMKTDLTAIRSENVAILTENRRMLDENYGLRERITTLEGEVVELREGNAVLADSLGKLIEAWPPSVQMPVLDPNWMRFKRH
jgi:predicted nuclease with TOPRIM domain